VALRRIQFEKGVLEVASVPGQHDYDLPVIGWREWLALPELGVEAIKAKVDTGARSSALHAFEVEIFRRNGIDVVRFKVHPYQRDATRTIESEAKLLALRHVRNSGGQETLRPVIVTQVSLLGQIWDAEVTLTSRDAMGFRMLLGRQAVRGRFLVQPARSFLAGRLKKKISRAEKRKRGESK
jgi:hypothetical protein